MGRHSTSNAFVGSDMVVLPVLLCCRLGQVRFKFGRQFRNKSARGQRGRFSVGGKVDGLLSLRDLENSPSTMVRMGQTTRQLSGLSSYRKVLNAVFIFFKNADRIDQRGHFLLVEEKRRRFVLTIWFVRCQTRGQQGWTMM